MTERNQHSDEGVKVAGVVIDNWKLPFFERHLSNAGYSFEQHPGLTSNTLLITVKTENLSALEPVIRAANAEAEAAEHRRSST